MPTRIAERFGRPAVLAACREVGVASPTALLATYVTDRAGLESYAQTRSRRRRPAADRVRELAAAR